MAGVPTLAFIVEPVEVGVVVSDEVTIRWTDYDDFADTLDTLIDLFYTPVMPPTFRLGTVPIGLEGTRIVGDIPEYDKANAWNWDVSEVPSGSYFLYTLARDPPFDMIAFSVGVVTVHHEGDPVYPAISVVEPDGHMDVGRGTYTIEWMAFDPDGTGKVSIEATRELDGSDRVLVAEGLDPAEGRFVWETTGFEKGNWLLHLRIEDERDLFHEAWARYFVIVADPIPDGSGSGAGGATGSAGSPGAGGSGGAGGRVEQGPTPTGGGSGTGGGGCSAGAAGSGGLGLALGLCLAGWGPGLRLAGRRRQAYPFS